MKAIKSLNLLGHLQLGRIFSRVYIWPLFKHLALPLLSGTAVIILRIGRVWLTYGTFKVSKKVRASTVILIIIVVHLLLRRSIILHRILRSSKTLQAIILCGIVSVAAGLRCHISFVWRSIFLRFLIMGTQGADWLSYNLLLLSLKSSGCYSCHLLSILHHH